MADLTAADVTVTINDQWIQEKKKYCECTVTFGDGSKTYPTGGVPMPTYEKWGMKRSLSVLMVVEANAGGYFWEYDVSVHKLRALRQGGNVALTVKGSQTAADKTAFVSIVEGDGTAQSGICVAHAGGGSDVPINAESKVLPEMANVAIAAQTLIVLALGW